MNLVWAHDHYFIYDTETKNYYSEIEFGYSVWERYLYSFDNITVASRVVERKLTIEERSKYNLSSGPNVEFLHLPNINSLKQKLKYNFKVNKKLELLLEKNDALIARLPSQLGIISVGIAKKKNKPFAIELVGCPEEALGNLKNWKAKLFKPYMVYKTKKAVSQSEFVLYVTQNHLQKKYPTIGKSVACSNVVLNNQIIYKKIYDKTIAANNIIKIGLTGFLSEYKGIDTAFKICKELDSNKIKYKLEILGGGERLPWIKLAESLGLDISNLEILTLPSGKPVLKWLENIDIYMQPSRTEGLPRGLIEAMSVGRPAIGSNAGGIPELLAKEDIFDKEDYKGMARRVVEIINNQELKNSMSKRNLATAKEYSSEVLDTKRKEFWRKYYIHVTKNKEVN